VALLVRGVSGWFSGPAGPQEVRYITIAQGILDGSGFQGLDKRYPDIIQPPLHMLMLAGAIAVIPNPLLAARALTVFLGALLILPVALLAWRIYGPGAAWRSALIVAVYPLLIHHSGISLTEPVFGLLVACTVVALQRVVAGSGGARQVATAGICLGLAFLDRPEGLAYLAAASAFLLAAAWRPLRRGPMAAVGWTGLIVACFAAFAVPYSAWLHERTGHWGISPKAALTQVHNMIMTEALAEHWPEEEGTAVFYERVKFGLNDEGTDLRSSEMFRALGLLPSEGRPTEKVSLIGDVLRPSYLVRVVVRNFGTLYLETLKYGLVLPTLFLGLAFIGITAEPWACGPSRRSHVILVWFLVAGCSWALSYVQARFLYASVGLIVPWVARGWVRLEEWARASLPGPRLAPASAGGRTLTISIALVMSASALAHAVPPAQLTRTLWEHHRDAGLELRRIASSGDLVMGITPVVAFYANLPFELLPYAEIDAVIAYARSRNVRYLVADTEMYRLQRPQLLFLRNPQAAPRDLRPVISVGDGEKHHLTIYELRPPSTGVKTEPCSLLALAMGCR
jgi:4-amino-4-deoxy-L-arabinose transferase-like glycosyltransferase